MTNPYYGGGQALQGLAGLIEGIKHLRDPDKAQRDKLTTLIAQNPNLRDQYITQFQDNPAGLDALIGGKPRFGSTEDYDTLRRALTGPVSPEFAARSQRAKNDLALAQGESRLITKGQAEELNNPAGMIARNVGKDASGKTMIEIPTSEFQNPEDRISYQELKAGKILTPAERATQKAVQQHAELLAQQETARTPGIVANAEKQAKDLALATENEKTTRDVMARLKGKENNLYIAIKKGLVSPEEAYAIRSTPAGRDQVQDGLDEWYKTQQLQLEQQRINQSKKDAQTDRQAMAAQHFQESAINNGFLLGQDVAMRMVKDPQSILDSTNPADVQAQDFLKQMRSRSAKDPQKLAAAKNAVVGALMKFKALKREPTASDIEDLNLSSQLAFTGTGYSPYVFTQGESTDQKGFVFKSAKRKIVMQSYDPGAGGIAGVDVAEPPKAQTQKASKDTGNVTLPSDTSKTQRLAPADAYESLKKKYPKETQAQLIQRVNKGEQ